MSIDRRSFLQRAAAVVGALAITKSLPETPVAPTFDGTKWKSSDLLARNDGAYDLGASGTTRFRDLYVGQNERIFLGQRPRRVLSLSLLHCASIPLLQEAYLKEQVILVEHFGHGPVRMVVTKMACDFRSDGPLVYTVELTETFNLREDKTWRLDRVVHVVQAEQRIET